MDEEKDMGMGPHWTGVVVGGALGLASKNAGMALIGYGAGNLGHRAIRDAVPMVKEDVSGAWHSALNKVQNWSGKK